MPIFIVTVYSKVDELDGEGFHCAVFSHRVVRGWAPNEAAFTADIRKQRPGEVLTFGPIGLAKRQDR